MAIRGPQDQDQDFASARLEAILRLISPKRCLRGVTPFSLVALQEMPGKIRTCHIACDFQSLGEWPRHECSDTIRVASCASCAPRNSAQEAPRSFGRVTWVNEEENWSFHASQRRNVSKAVA